MNERKLSNFCMVMLAFSMLVRLLSATGGSARAQETAAQPRVWRVEVIREQGGDEADAQTEKDIPAQKAEPDKPASAAPEFSPEEADAITIAGGCTYTVDKAALLTRPSELDFSGDGPKVLIVHTHSSEAYTQETGWEYEESDLLRTEERSRSVIRVGDEIASVLESHGIEVLHDTALNDYPTYNGAYARMETTIEGYLKQYPSIQMVLDVHRDAAADAAGNQVDFTTQIGGESCAQVMLVVGTDQGGLTHPGWQENLANALKLQALLNRRYPGLCRNLDLRTERFNQHETPGSLLAEFGSTGNTLREAICAGRCFAEGVAELIEGLSASSGG